MNNFFNFFFDFVFFFVDFWDFHLFLFSQVVMEPILNVLEGGKFEENSSFN